MPEMASICQECAAMILTYSLLLSSTPALAGRFLPSNTMTGLMSSALNMFTYFRQYLT